MKNYMEKYINIWIILYKSKKHSTAGSSTIFTFGTNNYLIKYERNTETLNQTNKHHREKQEYPSILYIYIYIVHINVILNIYTSSDIQHLYIFMVYENDCESGELPFCASKTIIVFPRSLLTKIHHTPRPDFVCYLLFQTGFWNEFTYLWIGELKWKNAPPKNTRSTEMWIEWREPLWNTHNLLRNLTFEINKRKMQDSHKYTFISIYL